MTLKFFIVLLIFATSSSESSKVLCIHTSFAKSHVMPMQLLAKELANRGHEITFISPFPLSEKVNNYRDVKIEISDRDAQLFEELSKKFTAGANIFKFAIELMNSLHRVSNDTLQSSWMREMMATENFDLVLSGYSMSEYQLGLADHFKCPSIVFWSGHVISSLTKMVGNPLSPEAVPNPMMSRKEMSFIGRVKNLLLNGLDLFVIRSYFNYRSKIIYDYNFPPDRYRSYDEMIRNVSLVLVNTHFTSSGPRPLLPNLVEVGGLQVKPNPAPLPEDLKTFLDDAKDGAILFSFGSNAKSIYIPEDKQKIILKVFSKLKQRVIMKWESDVLPGKPKNVLISKWLPQDDILAHPNIKAFISHCGYGGVIEAKSNGVPIIGIPLGADQKGNADKIVEEGWAVRLDMTDITEESLTNALKEILSNPKYRDIVGKQAILAKDRPMNAQDTAVYWVEYVLRHNGAPHLHYPGADLNFFQANSIDVILFIFAVIYAAFKVIKLICGFIFCRSKKGSNEKLKRN
ncbi:unnamed protein product [Chironomus riparius]|uniref:UDP-glucuronosyltransferase n=1 Tax=Chironomus riparius TaxID=315576 RepID=A0A9N9WLM0_9DIPT|nr:unnamed protein product [Chironomus riparius]